MPIYTRVLALTAGALLALPALAAAQDAPAPPAPAPAAAPAAAPAPASAAETIRYRHGLFGGGAVWAGNLSCDGGDCGGFSAAGGLSGHIGYMFTPHLGLLLDVWGMTSGNAVLGLTYEANTIDLRYWLTRSFFIEGGVGSGYAQVHILGNNPTSNAVPVGLLAVGYEVTHGHTWAIDIALQAAQGTSVTAMDGSNGSKMASTGRGVGLGAHVTWFSWR